MTRRPRIRGTLRPKTESERLAIVNYLTEKLTRLVNQYLAGPKGEKPVVKRKMLRTQEELLIASGFPPKRHE